MKLILSELYILIEIEKFNNNVYKLEKLLKIKEFIENEKIQDLLLEI